MKASFRISFQRIAIMLLLLALFMPVIFSQTTNTVTATSISEWLRNNMAVIALIVSEAMAFLPSKATGIVKAALSIFQAIFKKKGF